jgi:hypothetical protein
MERMVDSHEFHKIWVIESLRDGDLKTGTRLVEDQLSLARSRYENLEVAHRRPTSKTELMKDLQTIRDEALFQGLYPFIHFDCHGDPNGLQTTNGDHYNLGGTETPSDSNKSCLPVQSGDRHCGMQRDKSD